jgi:hypothetical protein
MKDYNAIAQRLTLLKNNKKASLDTLALKLANAMSKKDELLQEQQLIERTKVALEQARPLISASSIRQLEMLANTALHNIFDIPGEIQFDVESKRFVINSGEQVMDLAEASGGGLVTVISFVFDLFLLVKKGCRKLLVYDEAFYAVSDQYFEDFVNFMKQACHDLGVDILLVSHDARLTVDMVDRAYRIENGKSVKVK